MPHEGPVVKLASRSGGTSWSEREGWKERLRISSGLYTLIKEWLRLEYVGWSKRRRSGIGLSQPRPINLMMPLIHECADPQDAEAILFLKTRRSILVAQLRYLDRKIIELVNSNGWQCTEMRMRQRFPNTLPCITRKSDGK